MDKLYLILNHIILNRRDMTYPIICRFLEKFDIGALPLEEIMFYTCKRSKECHIEVCKQKSNCLEYDYNLTEETIKALQNLH